MTPCRIICEEDLTGTLNQCLAVSEALGKTSQEVIISAGRKSFIKAAWHKIKNPKSFWVWLQKPPLPWPKPDLIAAPAHDQIGGKNVIHTTGAPNRITPQALKQARKDFPHFKTLPSPRIAVLIGGNSRTHTLTPQIMSTLIERLQTLDASLMITTSRRTPPECKALLSQASFKQAHIWDETGLNPYLAMLSFADTIIATNDSVSMLSDAGTTGKPLYMIKLEGNSKKFDRFHTSLIEQNIAKPFEGSLEMWSYEPLNDAAHVAMEIKKRINKL